MPSADAVELVPARLADACQRSSHPSNSLSVLCPWGCLTTRGPSIVLEPHRTVPAKPNVPRWRFVNLEDCVRPDEAGAGPLAGGAPAQTTGVLLVPALQPSRPARRNCARSDAHIVAALARNADSDGGNGLGQTTAAFDQGSLDVVSSTELLAAGGDTVVIGRTASERLAASTRARAPTTSRRRPPLGLLEQDSLRGRGRTGSASLEVDHQAHAPPRSAAGRVRLSRGGNRGRGSARH